MEITLPTLYIISILLFSYSSYAQMDYDFSGYVYDLPAVQEMPDYADNPSIAKLFELDSDKDHYFMNIVRLRLTPEIYLSQNDEITIHHETNFLAAEEALPYFEGTGMTNRQAVDLFRNPVNEDHYSVSHYIDRLYYTHYYSKGDITVGRQMIAWGVGRIWQPMDLFNPINPANYSKLEKDGADAVSFKHYFGGFTNIHAVVNFRERLDQTNLGARFLTNFSEYDVSGMAGFFDNEYVFGANFEGNFFEAGLRGEAVFAADKDDFSKNYVNAILGIDYQFTKDLYALAEYQYNGEGTYDKKEYLTQFQRLIKGEIQNLGVNYIAAQASYQIHALVNGSAFVIHNINDGSGLVSLNFTYNVLQNMNIGLAGITFYGRQLSEYWYYPSALYLTGQYYF